MPSRTGHLKRGRGWGGRAEHMGTLKQTRHGTTARGILRFHGDTSLRGAARGRAQPLQSRPRRSQRPSRGAPAPGSGPTRARLEASPQMLCRDGGRAAPTCREGAGRPRRSPRPASPLGHSVLVGSRVSRLPGLCPCPYMFPPRSLCHRGHTPHPKQGAPQRPHPPCAPPWAGPFKARGGPRG